MATICSLCNKKISIFKMRLKFKDGVVGQSCLSKLKLCNFWAFEPGAKEYAESHTIADLKELQTSGKDFTNIQNQYIDDETKKELQKKQEKKQERQEKIEVLKEFKDDGATKFSSYYFDLKKNKILSSGSLTTSWRVIDFSEVLSYQVNKNGHLEHKHHGITRAVTGGILAGGVGAIVGATTGGKNTDYIDHLGLVINLSDGTNFEVKFLKTKTKTNSFTVKTAEGELRRLISIVQSGMNKVQEKAEKEQTKANRIKIESNADPAEEIRKFKKLADEGIISNEEFEAKKKQLLNL
ncbi:DUF4428 domain-containing protein [Lactobacillus johnsonii]|uniref:DUF4428 domain-containing protein n=1 Tax=Lactobacillus johnsonii TaxID=33959 RepID=UPI00388FCBC0